MGRWGVHCLFEGRHLLYRATAPGKRKVFRLVKGIPTADYLTRPSGYVCFKVPAPLGNFSKKIIEYCIFGKVVHDTYRKQGVVRPVLRRHAQMMQKLNFNE